MRNIVNISLPRAMAQMVKKEVKSGRFSTTSEFFRHLLRLWNEYQLSKELTKDRKQFASGKGRILRSLRDLR